MKNDVPGVASPQHRRLELMNAGLPATMTRKENLE
jgi:hypothetical protein